MVSYPLVCYLKQAKLVEGSSTAEEYLETKANVVAEFFLAACNCSCPARFASLLSIILVGQINYSSIVVTITTTTVATYYTTYFVRPELIGRFFLDQNNCFYDT